MGVSSSTKVMLTEARNQFITVTYILTVLADTFRGWNSGRFVGGLDMSVVSMEGCFLFLDFVWTNPSESADLLPVQLRERIL